LEIRKGMKRVLSIGFAILMLCCLLLANTGIIQAIDENYQVGEAYTTVAVTLDGNWATGEWEDSWIEWLNYSSNGERFCYKASSALNYAPEFLIDSADTTDDAGDIWQICFDGSVDGTTAPEASDNKIEITGHTTLKVYVGNGTGWVEMSASSVTWADSLTVHDVPLDFEHYCAEIIVDKATLNTIWGGSAPPIGLRVAMYDANTSTWLAWPPASDPDVPDSWGQITGGAETIPESFTFAVVVLLSSVAVAVGFYFARKRPKTKNYIPGKTGEINYTS
jgi:hypothetical protein